MTLRVVIWGLGGMFKSHGEKVVRELEAAGATVVALTAADLPEASPVGCVPLVRREDVAALDPDLVILMLARGLEEAREEAAVRFGLDPGRIVSYRELEVAGIDTGLAALVRANPVAIVSNGLWGGRACKALGLAPTSPLAKTQVAWRDFLRIAARPGYYLGECDPVPAGTRLDDHGRRFAVIAVGDVLVNVRETQDVDEALYNWEALRWASCPDDILVEAVVTSPARLEELRAATPHRLLCHVPFHTDAACAARVVPVHGERILYRVVDDLPFRRRGALPALVGVLFDEKGSVGRYEAALLGEGKTGQDVLTGVV